MRLTSHEVLDVLPPPFNAQESDAPVPRLFGGGAPASSSTSGPQFTSTRPWRPETR